MNTSLSCGPPLRFLGPTSNLAPHLSAYALRRALSPRNLPNVLRRNAQLPCDMGINAVNCRGVVDFGDCRFKLDRQVELRSGEYADHHNACMHKGQGKSVSGSAKQLDQVAKNIKALRERLEMSQQRFALALGVDQGSVSRWERGKIRPTPETFARMAKLSDDEKKLYFLEEAGVPASYFLGEKMLPEMLFAASEAVAKSLEDSNQVTATKGIFTPQESLSIIPYVQDPLKVGTKEAMSTSSSILQFPSSWLPLEGTLQATRFPNPGIPYMSTEVIGIVDVSRRDPDRLVGCIVAVIGYEGLEAMVLRRDGTTYLLLPIGAESSRVRVLKSHGVGSIAGRICKWIGDAPEPKNKKASRRVTGPA
ncbi:DNA-binding protein [Acidobacterium capsulatum ATCC 51196]|uniref:DNA-binding protein n=1 Tax=Acidobacterium capsulatum (strain ATCC 51196 / DSM 11244 / BCRC 80197 / JCM 7670 / NBRC 15755 / NCIMB 13165 / 161) TaxID=240015 RepID=C1FA11_ACIC5|nr:DNA-binding protein [Acidobacterium capsulatum ATCC 51196]